jgi:hypothetical protein
LPREKARLRSAEIRSSKLEIRNNLEKSEREETDETRANRFPQFPFFAPRLFRVSDFELRISAFREPQS